MSVSLRGGDKLKTALEDIAKRAASARLVRVGFMEGATYPDGTPVAAVAAWNEYGSLNRPPRPFFQAMINAEKAGWGAKVAAQLKRTNYNADRTLGIMGEDIKGALAQSITDFATPALAESTIERKGFEKPLVDTGHMLNSITYEVL